MALAPRGKPGCQAGGKCERRPAACFGSGSSSARRAPASSGERRLVAGAAPSLPRYLSNPSRKASSARETVVVSSKSPASSALVGHRAWGRLKVPYASSAWPTARLRLPWSWRRSAIAGAESAEGRVFTGAKHHPKIRAPATRHRPAARRLERAYGSPGGLTWRWDRAGRTA